MRINSLSGDSVQYDPNNLENFKGYKYKGVYLLGRGGEFSEKSIGQEID